MATQESILLTGATGNVGAVTLEHLLQSTRHKVNVVLRKASTAVPFFQSKFPSAVSSGQLTFTSVPDMAVAGVFDDAAASATVIIHIATPLGDGKDYVKTLIEPTWTIDHNILEAAKKSGTVKRVIICGTLLQALNPGKELFNPSVTINDTSYNDITFEQAKNGPWAPAYCYAKTNAEHKSWAWMKENKGSIGFDLVMLLPPLITGRSPQDKWNPEGLTAGGISWIYKALMKGEDDIDSGFPIFLDTDDVAHYHVLAIDPHIVKGNERYLLKSPELFSMRKVARELREKYPELRERIPALEEEKSGLEEKLCKVDATKAEKIFRKEYRRAVDSVKLTVDDVLRWEKESGAFFSFVDRPN